MVTLETTATSEGRGGAYLYIGDWKNAHSPTVLTLIPILINFPEDIDSISFLK